MLSRSDALISASEQLIGVYRRYAPVRLREACVYEPLRSITGSISAEHGIGLERKPYLEISRTGAEIATMRALKAALDPCGILNPGKVIDVY